MMRIFASSMLLAATTMLSLSCLVNASLNDIDEHHYRRRDLLLRGAGERRQEEDRQLGASVSKKEEGLVTAFQEYGEMLRLYQMDTSLVHSDDPPDHHGDVTQPFSKILPYGASGELLYRPHGWEFMYSFVGTNLPPGESYELIYYPNTADPVSDIACIDSGIVRNLGVLTMTGIIQGFPDMPKPSDFNWDHGAKIWLVPSSDINCKATPKNMTATPQYARYLFSGKEEYLWYDYLGG